MENVVLVPFNDFNYKFRIKVINLNSWEKSPINDLIKDVCILIVKIFDPTTTINSDS